MKQKTLFWLVLFLLLAAVGAGVYWLRGGSGTVAVLSVNGEVYDTIDLASVAVAYERTIETDYGWNTIRVSHGAIEVTAADCPDKLCVRQGAITDGVLPIVCLPHRLVIQIEEP